MIDEAARACKTGCCGDAESVHSKQSAVSSKSVHCSDQQPQACSTGCCGGSEVATEKDYETAPPCKTGCSGDAASVSSKSTSSTSPSMYCDESQKCDEICIKAAAALECKLACDAEIEECSGDEGKGLLHEKTHAGHDHLEKHGHKHGEDGKHPEEPCISHIQAAMDRYAAYLESARCICRSAIESATKSSKQCAPPAALPCSVLPHGQSSAHAYGKHGHGVTKRVNAKKTAATRCFSSSVASINSMAHDHAQDRAHDHGNCGDHDHGHHSEKTPAISEDVEVAGANRDHVLLNVTGMDCSGCANNLTRALNNVPGVANVKVTFITGTAELDLNPVVTSLNNVIRAAERGSGYRLLPFDSDNQVLDIKMDRVTAEAFQGRLPKGVESCMKAAADVYEVNYDPCLIQARDVLRLAGGQLAPPRAEKSVDAGHRRLVRIGQLTAIAFILTMPVVVLEWGDFTSVPHSTVLIISIILGTLVQCIAYPEFYKPAFNTLIHNRILEMDMLVVISITAAYGYSIVASGLILDGRDLELSPFFETSTLLITLVLFGRLLAAWARKQAISRVSLRSLQTSTALLVDPTTDNTSEIDARLLHFGDKIKIQPHSQVVTDADVIEGTSEVDESMLTGESMPVLKNVGSSIISGTINGSGILTARVTRLPGKNTITDIANLVEQAHGSKPKIQDLADKIAGYFIPVVCSTAAVVFAIWIAVALKVRDQAAAKAVGTAISYSIAVLAVSCPCALGLAVPMVLVVAGGIAAKGGIIIKTADVTARGYKVTDVVFDKTGTLTEGHLEVVKKLVLDSSSGINALSLAKALVKDNKHPVSAAVAGSLSEIEQSIELDEITSIPGCGIQASFSGTTVRAGNTRWLNLDDHPTVLSYKSRGMTLLCITHNETNDPLAIFALISALRPEAPNVITQLHARNITVHIVSGDNAGVVSGVAQTLGIPLSNTASERSPAQKQAYVATLMATGKVTLFCGDGTNDAVAVAQADVGVQIESTSDVTRSTADVVLLGGLDGVVALLDVSKAAFRRIRFNFIWSAVYNVLAILLAGGAFVRFSIPPAFAGLGEVVSVLPVVVVAMTMPGVKKDK